MKPGFLFSLAAACCIGHAAAAPAPAATPAATATAAAPSPAGVEAPVAPPPAAINAAPLNNAAAMPAAVAVPASPAGSLLQTVLSLAFVLALLIGLAWLARRYGPKAGPGSNAMRVVGSLSLGGRERVVLIEVADQWIVVGASPGRVNALASLPRPDQLAEGGTILTGQNGLAASNFSEWLKQTLEKRNGK